MECCPLRVGAGSKPAQMGDHVWAGLEPAPDDLWIVGQVLRFGEYVKEC